MTTDGETAALGFDHVVHPTDFSVGGDGVSYHGPAEWSYRRLILHYAHLCALAGGVSAVSMTAPLCSAE